MPAWLTYRYVLQDLRSLAFPQWGLGKQISIYHSRLGSGGF